MSQPPAMETLLERHRESLVRWVRSRASGLLEFESDDDVVQGIHARALAVKDRYEHRGDAEFFGWLAKVAAQYVSNRYRHWTAQRRQGGKLLRITARLTQTGALGGGVPEPAGGTKGPSTRAERREQLSVAARAIDLLMPRDRDLVRWMSEDVAIEEVAKRLGIGYDAAERARLRAVERFRKAYAVVERTK